MVDPVAAGASAFGQAFGAGMSAIKAFQQEDQFKKAQAFAAKQEETKNRLKNFDNLVVLGEAARTESMSPIQLKFLATITLPGLGIDPKSKAGKFFIDSITSDDDQTKAGAIALATAFASNPEEGQKIVAAIEAGNTLDIKNIKASLLARGAKAPTAFEAERDKIKTGTAAEVTQQKLALETRRTEATVATAATAERRADTGEQQLEETRKRTKVLQAAEDRKQGAEEFGQNIRRSTLNIAQGNLTIAEKGLALKEEKFRVDNKLAQAKLALSEAAGSRDEERLGNDVTRLENEATRLDIMQTNVKRGLFESSGAFRITDNIEVGGVKFKRGQSVQGRLNKETGRVEITTPKGVVSLPGTAVVGTREEGKAVSRTGRLKARREQFTTLGRLNAITIAREKTRNLPEGAFGLRGNVARGFGRTIREVGAFIGLGAVGEEFAKKVTGGATLVQLRQIGVDFRSQIAKSIEDVTGEQSGRISEAERELTQQTLGLMSSLANKDELMQVQFNSQQLGIMKLRRQARFNNDPPVLEVNAANITNTLNTLRNDFKMTLPEAQATAVLMARQDRFFSLSTNVLGE